KPRPTPISGDPRVQGRRQLLPRTALLRLLRGSFLLSPSASEDPGHRVVALMARVLIDRIAGQPRHETQSGPGPRVHGRIGDRELVFDRVLVDAREPFDGARVL